MTDSQEFRSNRRLGIEFETLLQASFPERVHGEIPGIVRGIKECPVEIEKALEQDIDLSQTPLFDLKRKTLLAPKIRAALVAVIQGETENAKVLLDQAGERIARAKSSVKTSRIGLRGLAGRDVNYLFSDDPNRGYDGSD